MQKKKSILEHVGSEEQRHNSDEPQEINDERQKLVVQTVKLPNGATFTKLKPVGAT